MRSSTESAEEVRTAEIIGTLCLATDLGMGFPFEHGLQTTVIAMRLADTLGVDRETAVQTYYASLLAHAGCTTDVHVHAQVFGSSMTENFNPLMYGSSREVITGLIRSLPDPGASGPTRAAQVARRLPRMIRGSRPALAANCEVAGMLADQTGAPGSVAAMLDYLLERWDGRGPLHRARGEGIPLPMRIVHVAIDAALQRHLGGAAFAASLVGERSGHAFDPDVGGCLTQQSGEILAFDDATSAWDEVLAAGARATADAQRRRGGSRARCNGPLRGPRLAVPLRALVGSGRARSSGCGALWDRGKRRAERAAGGSRARSWSCRRATHASGRSAVR